MGRIDTKDTPVQGHAWKTWMSGIECPFCDSTCHHVVGTVPADYFDGNFSQGCFLALVLYCESSPDHIFYFLVGEHKGSLWFQTLAARREV